MDTTLDRLQEKLVAFYEELPDDEKDAFLGVLETVLEPEVSGFAFGVPLSGMTSATPSTLPTAFTAQQYQQMLANVSFTLHQNRTSTIGNLR